MHGPITLDDVAREAGVSRAAVSRALNGRPGVRPEARAHIEAVAARLAYRPNRAARTLAGGRPSTIGLVLAGGPLVDDAYHGAVIQAVIQSADEADLALMIVGDSSRPAPTSDHVVADMVDGVVVTASSLGHPWAESLFDRPIPLVMIGAHDVRDDVVSVHVDNEAGARAMVHHLARRGARRIAFLRGPARSVEANDRLRGYRSALAELGLDADPALEFDAGFHYPDGERVADAVFAARPDAVFTANDDVAMAMVHRAAAAGIRVPDDLLIAGFDGLGRVDQRAVGLSSVRQPLHRIADLAIAHLRSLIAGEPVAGPTVVPAELWIDRTA